MSAWRDLRLRRAFERPTGGTWGSDAGEADFDVLCIRGTDFDMTNLRVDESRVPVRSITTADWTIRRLRPGDIVIEKSGGGELQPVGRAVLFDLDRAAVPTNFAARLRALVDYDARFLTYLLSSCYANGTTRSAIKQTTGIQNLDLDAFLSERVLVPDEQTQSVIADFLDAETARIDALIEKKRRMIALLRDRFVSMRRTVFDRLADQEGEIALRRVSTCLDGRRIPLNAEERSTRQGPYPYWGAGTIVDRIDDYLFNEPLVLLGEDGAPFFDASRDVAFHVTEPVWVNNHIHVLRPDLGWQPEFLMHMLNAVDFSRYISGSTRDKLTQSEMDSIRLPAASLDEQEDAVAKLDAFSQRATSIQDRLARQIELLSEHRQALITAAVTGELDVAKAAA